MAEQYNILDEVKQLQAYFALGYKRATTLRKKLEDDSSPSSSRKGEDDGELTHDQKKQLTSKRNTRLIAKSGVIGIAVLFFLASCTASKEPKYRVRSIEHLKGNAYLVKTDSFTAVKCFRGMGRFPDSVKR